MALLRVLSSVVGWCAFASASRDAAAKIVKSMGVGINMGNTLEAPFEGQWAPAAQEHFFDEYLARNFSSVRIPVRWDMHTGRSAPFAVDRSWMDRVAEVVGWSVSRGLVTVINTHHDSWLDTGGSNFSAMLPREVAIWTQISERFKEVSNELLVFEVFNEPHVMSIGDLNALNAAAVGAMRAAENPDRLVLISGLEYGNPRYLISNPEALAIPNDPMVAVEVHNYDPYGYTTVVPGIDDPTWGSPSDVAAVETWMSDVAEWAAQRDLSVFYGEFGVTHDRDAASGRNDWYAAHLRGILSHGFAAAVWDDCGDFMVYDRNKGSWDNDVLLALGKVPKIAQ